MDSLQTLILLLAIILFVIISCAIAFLLWSKHFFDRQKNSFSDMVKRLQEQFENRYWDFLRQCEKRYEIDSMELHRIGGKMDKNYEELSDSIMRTTKLFREKFYGYEKQHLSTDERYMSPSSEAELFRIVEGLQSTREIIYSGKSLDMRAVSKLRTLFFRLQHHFRKQLNADDEEQLTNAVEILGNNEVESIDRLTVCESLDYFIAKFGQPSYDEYDSKRLTAQK